MNQRRLLLLALGVSLSGRSALLCAQTRAASRRRVGVLAPSTHAKEEIILKPFFDQMRALGWIEGKNIAYDRVYADDQHERLPKLAAELVGRKPEVIYAPPTPATVAAARATQTIPIVFAVVPDPVGTGLVTSLARPGGNVTGMSTSAVLWSKYSELRLEILPLVKRIGELYDSNDPMIESRQKYLKHPKVTAFVASRGLTYVVAEAANPVEFEAAVARLVAERVEVISLGGASTIAYNQRTRLIELANKKRLPVIAGNSKWPDAGALYSYGASLDDLLRRSALLVDKILKGAKPADLPVEQPNVHELVVNMKTAKTLGIKIPSSILLRADRVIE